MVKTFLISREFVMDICPIYEIFWQIGIVMFWMIYSFIINEDGIKIVNGKILSKITTRSHGLFFSLCVEYVHNVPHHCRSISLREKIMTSSKPTACHRSADALKGRPSERLIFCRA